MLKIRTKTKMKTVSNFKNRDGWILVALQYGDQSPMAYHHYGEVAANDAARVFYVHELLILVNGAESVCKACAAYLDAKNQNQKPKTKIRITTQKQLRREFRETFHELDCKKYQYGDRKTFATDTRVAWCDWLDSLVKNGEISENLAFRATLD